MMNEIYRSDRHVIDLELAHAGKEKTEAAYSRVIDMDRRRELAQFWADLLLDGAMDLVEVVTGRRR